jgi:DNA repair exonuclease SbcCD nuclease subunit
MADLLYVGDPHATISELPDLERLMALICQVARDKKPDGVVFLGDQYHHHGIVHLEVVDFWMRAIDQLKLLTKVYLMVGNHDKPGNGRSDIHSMMIHAGDVTRRVHVIDKPRVFEEIPGTVFIPHMDSGKAFVEACKDFLTVPLVVCHQTFDGSRYENGFYAKDGIDPNLVPQEMILSGHIHAPQRFGKVWYVGAPRWRTSADANTERHLWLMSQAQGSMLCKAKFDTGEVCRRIIDLEEVETGGLVWENYDTKKDDVRLTLKGPEFWLKPYAKMRAEQGFKVRTICTDKSTAPRVRESEGITTALKKFVSAAKPKNNTPIPVLEKLVAERLHV